MTQAAVPFTTNHAITISDIIEEDGEARIKDLDLAAALGFVNPHMIRPLIKRHQDDLRRFGRVSLMREKPGPKGGRPGEAYSLNRRQAIFLTAKSGTPLAADITVKMTDVFDEYLTTKASKPAVRHDIPNGHAIVCLNGQTLTVDLTRYRLGPDDRALVIHPDGHLSVTTVNYDGMPNWFGARSACEPWREPKKGERLSGEKRVRDFVQIVGQVVESASMPGASKPAPSPEPIPGPFAPGSDLLMDLHTAVWNAQLRVEDGEEPDFAAALVHVLDDRVAKRDGRPMSGKKLIDRNYKRRKGAPRGAGALVPLPAA